MKRRILIIVIGFLTLTTCGPEVKFVEPQPQGISNLKFIPKLYQGTFRSQSDSALLFIDSVSINKQWQSIELIHRDSLEKELKMKIKRDTSFMYQESLLFDKSVGLFSLTIKLKNDSAKVWVKGSEILFTLSDSQLVRDYRKFCFLNYKTKDGYWLVKTLKMNGDFLDFSDLINSKEVDTVGKLTKITTLKDTTGGITEYRLNPSRKELRKILKGKKIEKNYVKLSQP